MPLVWQLQSNSCSNMRIKIDHITKYEFSSAARSVIQILRMTPNNHNHQSIVNWDINIDCDGKLNAFTDAYGNKCHMLTIDKHIDNLTIETIGIIDTVSNSGVLSGLDEPLRPQVFIRNSPLATWDNELKQYADENMKSSEPLASLHDLMNAIYRDFKFMIGATDTVTDAKAAFKTKSGVCQDLAHVFIACARARRIPSRYISGHLLRRDGNDFQEAAHAWAESFIDGLGWVAFDPANGICADENYVRIACGLDYRDAAPISGSRIGGGHETMSVGLHVRSSKTKNQSQGQNQG